MEKAQAIKEENSPTGPEVDDLFENSPIASLKIREEDRQWMESEQARLRAKERKKVTQANLFARMRATYERSAALGNPPTETSEKVGQPLANEPELGVTLFQQSLAPLVTQLNSIKQQNEEILQKLRRRGPVIQVPIPRTDAPGKIAIIEGDLEKELERAKGDRPGAHAPTWPAKTVPARKSKSRRGAS